MKHICNLIDSIIGLAVIIFLLEICGCPVCRAIGNMAGECVNGYKNTTSEIHPNDLR